MSNLVLIIRKTGRVASNQGINVFYTVGGEHCQMQTHFGVAIGTGGC